MDSTISSTSGGQDVIAFLKPLLVNRIFLGTYKERRYVTALRQYRDVVEVGRGETDLQNDLDVAINRLSKTYGIQWIGITRPDTSTGHYLWVNLPNLPFDTFWFQIRQVKFNQGEVLLRIKSIRLFSAHDNIQTKPELDSTKASEANVSSGSDPSSRNPGRDDREYTFEFDPNVFVQSIRDNIIPLITYQNCILTVRLMFAAMIGIISIFLATVHYAGEFFLKVTHELTNLIHALTPWAVVVMDFFTKAVGGLYILIAMLCGRNANPNRYATNNIFQEGAGRRPITYRNQQQQRPFRY